MQNSVTFESENSPEIRAGARDERLWSVLAHLSVFVNLVTGFIGPFLALILRLTRGRRSPVVGRHAMRSFWNQVVWLLLVAPVGALFTVSILLFLPVPDESFLILLVAVAAAWLAIPFAEGTWAAYRASRGEEYRYFLDRLTSVGSGKARHGAKKRRPHADLFDDDSDDDDAFYASDDVDFADDSSGDFSDGSDLGGDFGGIDFGGDSGSW